MNSKLDRRQVLTTTARSLAGAALLSTFAGGLAPAFAQESGGSGDPQAGDSGNASLNIYVFRGEQGIKGPDGKNHDAFVPSSFVLQAGVPTTLNIINYDEGPHTMTAIDLGVNILVQGGNEVGDEVQPVTTTASIMAPNPGVYRWYCALDCDGGGGHWDMTQGFGGDSQDGFMAGNIVVLGA